MRKPELRGMQRQPRRAAAIGLRRAAGLSIIDSLAAHRMAEFGKMNPNLMCAAGLQAARKKRIPRQVLFDIYMSKCLFAQARYCGPAGAALGAIADQEAGDTLGRHMTGDNRQIAAHHSMAAKLPPQSLLCCHRAGKYD